MINQATDLQDAKDLTVIVEPACLAHVDVKPDPMVARVHGHDEVVLARTYSHVTLDQLRDADQSMTSRAAK
jgi:hypothetical protein